MSNVRSNDELFRFQICYPFQKWLWIATFIVLQWLDFVSNSDNVTSIYKLPSSCEVTGAEDCGKCSSAGLDMDTIRRSPEQKYLLVILRCCFYCLFFFSMGELLYYAKANGNIQTLIHFNKPFFFFKHLCSHHNLNVHTFCFSCL